MRQPGDDGSALQWVHRPEIQQPIVVVAFEGWSDAGEAATATADQLIDHWDADLFATIDPEEFYDFTAARPLVELTETGARRLVWPENEFYWATIPETERPIIIVRGLEPQLKWRTFTDLVVDVAREFDASMVVTLGALLADVPHTRPTVLYGTSDDVGLAERLELEKPSYEGPTGILGVMHSRCAEYGIASASIWAVVPTYVPSSVSPKASLALTERLATLMDVAIDVTDLQVRSSDYERQVSEFVSQDEDTAAYVAELERQYDDGLQPSPEQLVEEVEQYLREQN